jgi:hypothetical protein
MSIGLIIGLVVLAVLVVGGGYLWSHMDSELGGPGPIENKSARKRARRKARQRRG